MKKTLADLKREVNIGTIMEMTFNSYNSDRIKGLLNLPRYVIKKNTVSVVLSKDKNETKGSYLYWPTKATLVEYDGDTLKLYDPGTRDLTAQERSILENMPSKRAENQEAVNVELITDGSGFFYKDKAYLRDHSAEYLAGHETIRGMRYNYNGKNIIDESIKGDLSLAYKITL